MNNNIRILCLLSICLGFSACSNEYSHDPFKDFKAVCEFSGGTFEATNSEHDYDVCKCGNKRCAEGIICSNGKCASECEDNMTKCKDNIKQKCKNGEWEYTETCNSTYGCTLDGTTCAECKNEVNDDRLECHDGKYQICVLGHLSTTINCPFGACNEQKACALCETDTIRCHDKKREICNEQHEWISFDCPNKDDICIKGECRGSDEKCDVDTKICSEGNWEICNPETGKLEIDTKEKCQSGVCNGENCAECADGSKCENNKLSQCQYYQWQEILECKCNSEGTNCDGFEQSCPENATKCMDSQTQLKCQAGQWTEETCDYGCDNNRCKTDAPQTECIDDTSCSEGQTCEDGECINQTIKCENDSECETQKCLDGNCVECTDGTARCQLDNKIERCQNGMWTPTDIKCQSCQSQPQCYNDTENIGHKYTCDNNGVWMTEDESPCDVSCNSENNDCGTCKNETKQCNGEEIQICNNGSWSNGSPCSSGMVCKDDMCTSKEDSCETDDDCESGHCDSALKKCTDCVGNISRCYNGVVQNCEIGSWKNDDFETKCTPKENTIECIDTGTGGIQYTYGPDGTWTTEGTKCVISTMPVSCKIDSNCGDCFNNTKDNNGKICVNGIYVDGCTNEHHYFEQTGKCESSPVCINNENNIGALYTFNTDTENWERTKPCDGDVSCTTDNKCGDCINNDSMLYINTNYSCVDGIWSGDECDDSTDELLCRNRNEGPKNEFGALYKCIDKKWKLQESCDDVPCVSNDSLVGPDTRIYNQCHNCSHETDSCKNNSELIGSLDGSFCPGNASCNSDCSGCSQCQIGTFKCEGSISTGSTEYECKDGGWQYIQDCFMGCDDTKMHCRRLN